MISVYLGDFHYKYDGKSGVLSNMINGIRVTLSSDDTIACNKSNANILKVIKKYKEVELHLDNWRYIDRDKGVV